MIKETTMHDLAAGTGIPQATRCPRKKGELRNAFHSSGLRLTRQRLAIYRELEVRCDHPDVDHLYKAVQPRIPQISLFTVYRTMNALESAGIILRVATWKGHARYDAHMATHAHFLCETCGKIDDVAGEGCAAPVSALAGLKGTVRHVDVMFRGECETCAVASPSVERA
jgi:Fur family transcriptional regulator, peroxide stress response regulator